MRRLIQWLWLTAGIGLILGIAASIYSIISMHDEQLGRIADLTQVYGFGLAFIVAIVQLIWWLAGRRTNESANADLIDTISQKILRIEERIRFSVLGNVIEAANSPFYAVDSTSDSTPQEDGRPSWHKLIHGLVQFVDEHEGSVTHELESIASYFGELESKRLVILGEPGAGKTVTALELTVRLLSNRLNMDEGRAIQPLIPVRLDLASWPEEASLEDWLIEGMELNYGISPAHSRQLLESRRLLPILDGLDEVGPDPTRTGPALQSRLDIISLQKMNEYINGHRLAPLVITCRAQRYREIVESGLSLHDAHCIRILPLDAPKISRYLDVRLRDHAAIRSTWKVILNRIRHDPQGYLSKALSNPWKLHLAVTFTEAGGDAALLVDAADLHDIDRLLLAEYIGAAIKISKVHDRRKFTPVKVEAWLALLAQNLISQRRLAHEFDDPRMRRISSRPRPPGLSGTDIVPHLLWPLSGERLIQRLHVALAITSATGAVVATVIFAGFAWNFFNVVAAIAVIVVAGLRAAVEWPSPNIGARRRFAIRRPLFLRLRAMLRFVLGGGVIVALIALLFSGLWPALGFVLSMLVAIVTTVIFMVGLGYGIQPTLEEPKWIPGRGRGTIVGMEPDLGITPWEEDVMSQNPYRTLKRDLTSSIVSIFGIMISVGALGLVALGDRKAAISIAFVALLIGWIILGHFVESIGAEPMDMFAPALFLVFACELALSPNPRSLASLAFVFVLLLVTSARAWTRYMLFVMVSRLRNRLPLRLGRFLDWAHKAGILRLAATSYQFRHQELQRWFELGRHV